VGIAGVKSSSANDVSEINEGKKTEKKGMAKNISRQCYSNNITTKYKRENNNIISRNTYYNSALRNNMMRRINDAI